MISLNDRIIGCRACPRLVVWREQIANEKRKAFADEEYWGKAVPNFGDPKATRLILGLAPAAHGANRTGRMFTGDRSGDWLFRALYKAGMASQPTSTEANDGLTLKGVMITAVCHCAPPDNKPLPSEIETCSVYLTELLSSREWESVLCLGSLAWNRLFRHLDVKPVPKFGHGVVYESVVGCFHPSQQNTFTGRLTEEMLDAAIELWLGRL